MLHQRVRTAVLLAVLPLVAGCIVVRRPANNRYGALWTTSHYPDWEPLVGQQDGLASYYSNPRRAGFGGFYERRFDNPYSAGILARYNQHQLTQTYQSGFGTNATIDGWFLQPSVGWRRNPLDWVELQFSSGAVITINTGRFKFFDNSGLLIHEQRRTHNGFNWQFGSSINVGPWNNWGLTAGYTRTNLFRKDADNNNTVHLGLWFDHVRIARGTPPPGTRARPPQDPTPPGTPGPPGDTTRAPPRPPGDTTRVPPRPPGDTTRTPPRPPETPPPSRPDSQEQKPTCCGLRGRFLTYPKLTDSRQPPAVQAAAWATAVAASNVLLPNGAFFHQAADLSVESVGFPFTWSRHYLSDLTTTAGGMIGHRWDFSYDKRILPLGGQDAGEGLVREMLGTQKASLMYFNGQGRVEIYEERLSGRRDGISNFGTSFSAHVTAYRSPSGAFHEIERYVLYDASEHPFKDHPNVDDTNNEAIFFVLREKNGLRYVFNCRGQLIHILSRHDYASLGALRPGAERDSVRLTIEYGGELNPLTQSPMPVRIRDTANRNYRVTSRDIGMGELDTNYECRPQRGPRPIPRIWKLIADGVEIEYQYQGGTTQAILDTVVVTTDSISGATRYQYDAGHRLLRLTPPKQMAKTRGDSVTIVNTYDGSGRVTEQQLGGGLLSWRLSYRGTASVNAINGGGDEWEYQLRPIGLYFVTATEIVRSRDGAFEGGPWITRYEHNASTQVTRLTMPRGNVVRYEYDDANGPVTLGPIRDFNRGMTYDNDLSLGNLIAVTSESGSLANPDRVALTIRYAFEPLFNQTVKETDARGNDTEYEYRYSDKGEFGNPVRIQSPGLSQPDGSRVRLVPVAYRYNTKGQVETIIDRRGARTNFTYAGAAWYLKQIDYPGGGVRTYDVDASGHVTEEGGTFGTTRYQLDARGRVIMREVVVGQGTGNRTWFEYDLHNKVTRTRTEVKDNFTPGDMPLPSGAAITLPRAAATDVWETTEYDLLDRPVREVTAGVERRYEYDIRGNLAASVTPSPTGTGVARTEFEYDARGLVVRRTPGLDESSVTTFEYDANANLVRRQSGPLSTRGIRWSYDAFDRVISQVDGRGTTFRRELDASGNTLRDVMAGASGDPRRPGLVTLTETESRYDEQNNVIVVRRRILDAARTIDEGRAFHNAAGDLARLVDAARDEKRFEYDEAGRTVAVIGADLTTRTTYDAAGRPTLVTEIETERTYTHSIGQTSAREVTRSTGFTYDVSGRITHQGGVGPEVRYFYNSLGQVRVQYEAGHGLTETQYDALGQAVLVQHGAAFEQFEYLPSGHVARQVTPGSSRMWRYDALGRVTEMRDEKSGALTFSDWNASGDQYRTRDPNGTVLERTFDAVGMPTRLDVQYGSSTVDDAGTARPTLVGPLWETYEYDGLGRLVRAATSQNVSTTMQYDGLGRVTAEVQERNGIRHRVEHAYAIDRSWQDILYPEALGSIRVRQGMMPSGLVHRVDVDGRTIAQFEYSGSDRLATRKYANRAVSSYTYDIDRRITGVEVSAPGTGNLPFQTWWTHTVAYQNERLSNVRERRLNQTGSPISASETVYTYDVAGRRLGATTTQRQTVAGEPDAVTMSGTLTQYAGSRTAAVAEYTMDGASDRVTMARFDQFEHDPALRITATTNSARVESVAAERGSAVRDIEAIAALVRQNPAASERQQFRYDRAGNLIADSAYIYTYDHANRLTRIAERSDLGFKEYAYFVYDALGRRVFMVPGRERTAIGLLLPTWQRQHVAFVYDGEHVIGELEMGNESAPTGMSLLARYVMGVRPGDRIRMDRRQNDEATSPLVTYYLHENGQGALALASDTAARQHWIGYLPAAGATSFRAPNDLHTIGGSRTRSPYLAGTTRVDGFSGIRYDERTRDRIHDFRDNLAFARRVDLQSMTEQMQAFTSKSLAAMAAVAAIGIGIAAAPTIPAIFELTAVEAASAAASAGFLSVGFGYASARLQGIAYTPGMAAGDFGEGALVGLVGGAMLKAGASLGAIAAADFATGFAAGFIRADPTEGLSDAVSQGAWSAAVGAGIGLGIGTVGKRLRGEQQALTDWPSSPAMSRSMPASSNVSELGGMNARWQREYRKPLPWDGNPANQRKMEVYHADRGVTADERKLERAVMRHLRNGTRASRLIAELITKGELKVRFREAISPREFGVYPFEDFVVVNINHAALRTGNVARQVAAVILHEGIHYLGGGELAAWFAHSKFMMSVGHLAAPPGLRYLTRRASPVNELVYEGARKVRQGADALGAHILPIYGRNVLSVTPIKGHVLAKKGMAHLIGMTRPSDLAFAEEWLRSRGGIQNGVPVRWW